MAITYSVYAKFRKDGIRKKDGKGQVFLLVGINSKQFRISTGIYIKPIDWNTKTELVRMSHPDYNDVNIEIRKRLGQANNIFDIYRRQDKELSKEIFLQEYYNPSSRVDFISYMKVKIERRLELGHLQKSTYKQHMVVFRKLYEFRKSIKFNQIDQILIDDFDLWHIRRLREERGENLVNQGNGPRSNAMKIIRTYLKLAQSDSLSVTIPKLETKQYASEAPYLTQSQVQKLIDIHNNNKRYPEHWKEILRTFLAMCFTGCSYTDIQDLKWEENIQDNMLKYIRNKMKKFRKKVTVPLTPIALQYFGEFQDKGFIFRQMHGQSFNRVLKEIAKEAGIKINLSAKVARDTFGTIFAEETGGDVFTLMELMGHTKIESTRKYVHLSVGHKESQMEKVFSGFSGSQNEN